MEEILHKAERLENEYDWLGAVGSYEKALILLPVDDFLRIGKICERLGYSFHRAAMQAENPDEFKVRCTEAVQSYQKAKEFYAKAVESRATPRMLRCEAMIAFLGYWLALETREKNRLVSESWRLTKESLEAFKEAGDAWNYGRTYNQLSLSAGLGSFLEWDGRAEEKMLKEAVEYGEQAVDFLSSLEAQQELSRAYVRTATYLELFGYYFADSDERNRYYQRAQGHWLNATQFSEETAEIELLNSAPLAVLESLGWGDGTDEALAHFQKALESGRKTKDNLIIGCALDWLAYNTFWKAIATEDPDERLKLHEEALHFAIEAKLSYGRILFVTPRAGLFWVEAPYAEHYWKLASYETDPKKRRGLLEKAREAASAQLKSAKDSGYPFIIGTAHHVSSRVLVDLARTETSSETKKRLLEKALEHRNESIRIVAQFGAFDYWNRGVAQSYLADIKSELANLTEGQKARKNLLQEAVSDKQSSLNLLVKDIRLSKSDGSTLLFSALGKYQYDYGDLLSRLNESVPDNDNPRKAAEAFKQAGESFQKAGIVSRTAECLWKEAQVHDALGEHQKAAKSFDLAADNYRRAKEKIPQLSTLYEDHACYMLAWGEIQRAKYHHARQEHGLAKEYFEKASRLHKGVKQWSYLAPNYAAWAQVEQAEELSRREQSEEAVKAFEQAAELFIETKKSVQTGVDTTRSLDEQQMMTSMIGATDLRREYCTARVLLEEAKILYKKSDYSASSEKYLSAIEKFENMSKVLESNQDRQEIEYIVALSQAWRKMTQAEIDATPALFMEASQLFEEAKQHSPNEKARMLALGHSRFCRALAAGTRFIDTRDTALHAMALQHLESAANYYTRADSQSASEYARATGLLFDAHIHMDAAAKESDPEKKVKLYMIAEKILQTSAGSFMKAGYPAKREQVLRFLQRVTEGRELAVSLNEVLHAPIVASTTAFPAPAPTFERAVGLERFEHAEVQANITVDRKGLRVGEELDMDIDLANPGKRPALLTKIADAVPEGFEIIQKPEQCRVEDHCLNMRGKRLDSLKTEEVRLVLKPMRKGTFHIRPKILYLDENGESRSHEPESLTITVRELGIRGWLKGER